ncbi:NAD(P)/FAD-dependent oxidoreductase [Salininema proteolyticum]|uniref:NAD(P)/FAD-dependent oxidoreductase n=1 Tax=Salininema proteolyticum TaxID=1607685 RepID=A0ABV8U102_9ACTN
MNHRIVILGGGYAGAHAASRIARGLRAPDASVTLVNAEPNFVERVRLHQVAAGQDVEPVRLDDLLAGTGVQTRVARVTGLDADAATVFTDRGELEYDTLVYALGSTGRAPEGTFTLSDHGGALRLREHLGSLRPGDPVRVVGGGLTGLEAATEIAESRPDLSVSLATSGRLGSWLAPGARRHVREAFARLGIAVEEGTTVRPGEGEGTTVWCAGFDASSLAADTVLETAEDGRIRVDRTMRSASHPDVYAVGDSAFVRGPGGRACEMRCGMGVPQAWQAANAIVSRLAGRRPSHYPLGYLHQGISLGRRDGVIQFVRWDDRARRGYLKAAAAARYKEAVCRFAIASVRWPSYFPTRRRAVVAAPALRGDEAHA